MTSMTNKLSGFFIGKNMADNHYHGDERRDTSWHLDKRVNVGHILTTLSLAGMMVAWSMGIETRIAKQSVLIEQNAKQIEQSELRHAQSIDNVMTVINRIDDKLDRLIERN
jgi:ribosomal 30S subunit maturation factor RimM